MLIRIKQNRKHAAPGGYGTDIDLTRKGEKTKRIYQFRPLDPKQPEGNHVCDVKDKDDLARLLAIPAGFEIHDQEMQTRAVSRPATEPEPQPETARAAKANGEGAGTKMSRSDLLAAVAEKTGKKPNPATSTKKLLALLAA